MNWKHSKKPSNEIGRWQASNTAFHDAKINNKKLSITPSQEIDRYPSLEHSDLCFISNVDSLSIYSFYVNLRNQGSLQ